MPTVGGDRGGTTVGTPDNIYSAFTPGLQPFAVFAPVTSALGETYPRGFGSMGGGGQTQLTSGTLKADAITLGPAGVLMSTITYFMGGTTFTTATAQWFAVYDQARRLLGVTADDGATAWTGNTYKTLTLAAPFRLPYAGLYYVALLWTGTGTPQPAGFIDAAAASLDTAANRFTGNTTDSGLTTPSTAPATLGTFATNNQGRLYAYAA